MAAKVFVSCGQARGTEEEHVAQEVGHILSDLGFEYYIAAREQTLKGIKENVFRHIETSEYYLFIDFKREMLSSTQTVFRGSVFTHQELAIAAYLDLPVLAFQEQGVKLNDGLMGFIQGNSVVFTERRSLPELVKRAIMASGWRTDWKNTLAFHRTDLQYVDTAGRGNEMTRFLHIAVENRHHRKLALNCYVYLQGITDLVSGRSVPVHSPELKWAGYTMPNALIAPRSRRLFDAGKVRHSNPSCLLFTSHTDSSDFWTAIDGPGQFELVYAVHSDTFRTEVGAFRLTLSERLEDLRLEPTS